MAHTPAQADTGLRLSCCALVGGSSLRLYLASCRVSGQTLPPPSSTWGRWEEGCGVGRGGDARPRRPTGPASCQPPWWPLVCAAGAREDAPKAKHPRKGRGVTGRRSGDEGGGDRGVYRMKCPIEDIVEVPQRTYRGPRAQAYRTPGSPMGLFSGKTHRARCNGSSGPVAQGR